MQFAVAKMEAQVAKIPMMVQRQVRQTIEEKTEEHLTEIRELNASHSRELSSLQVKLQNLSARYRELESNNRHIIDNLKREKDTLLAQMEAMLRLLGEKLEKAVRALIQFARVLAYKLSHASIRRRLCHGSHSIVTIRNQTPILSRYSPDRF